MCTTHNSVRPGSLSSALCLLVRHRSIVAQPPLYESHSPVLCLAIDDSELPPLLISGEFIRRLIPVARVGGGHKVGSVAISQSVLLSFVQLRTPFRTTLALYDRVYLSLPKRLQRVIKYGFAGMMRQVSGEKRGNAT